MRRLIILNTRLLTESVSLSYALCVFIIYACSITANSYDSDIYGSATSSMQVGPENQDSPDVCLEDDQTKLPIFSMKKTICNVKNLPVDIYPISHTHSPKLYKYCFKLNQVTAALTKAFVIQDDKLKMITRLNLTEIIVILRIIKVPRTGEPRKAINAIQFNLVIDDCNRVSWQTIAVLILFSVCVVLLSIVAIMLILYQQKDPIVSKKNDDGDDYGRSTSANPGRSTHQFDRPDNLNDGSFINPRRTSLYDFSAIAKAHNDVISDRQIIETENI